MATGLFALLGAVQLAIATSDAGALQQFLSVLMRMFAVTFGIGVLAIGCSSMQGILEDTANGMDEIESWPDLNFLDWFGEMFFILSGVFICVVPFVLVAKVFGATEVTFWAIVVIEALQRDLIYTGPARGTGHIRVRIVAFGRADGYDENVIPLSRIITTLLGFFDEYEEAFRPIHFREPAPAFLRLLLKSGFDVMRNSAGGEH